MRLRPGIAAIAFSVLFSPIAFAQTSDWAVVNQLLPGQQVKIETVNGKSHSGNVRSASDDAIVVGNQSVPKHDVQRILLRTPGRHHRNALIGLGIGAGFGLVAGSSCNGTGIMDPGKGACMGTGAAIFGAIGAGIGALLPSHGSWHEVYRRE